MKYITQEILKSCMLAGLVGIALAFTAVSSGAMEGAPADTSDCTEAIRSTIATELSLWYSERDGAMHFYQVPILLEMSKSEPDIFYSMMAADTAAFKSFLKALEFSVFNRPFGSEDRSAREHRLECCINAIAAQQVLVEYEDLRSRLLSTLNSITIVEDE